ncbi:AbrB family transcriptional regulator [Oricola sp.]|uniref:AbrB family transcriptional regulator n=1 Tax=Oricola sp. TaxID=1979950 RepID=UPI0025F4AE8D|nr:AbrB family transcriptional regulator [Oricola sp.]MCI5078544.1 AbrB family transcriptional regulator [Oricola sp.]
MAGFDWRRTAIALLAGFAGASIAHILELPAAALLGSTFAVTLASMARLQPALPAPLRDIGLCVIAVTLGSGVTPDIWSELAHWPLSIAMLALTMLMVMLICGFLLKRLFRADLPTAMMATAPGALSYALALANDRDADLRFVTVLQSLRLFLITMLLPPVIGYAENAGEGGGRAPLEHLTYPAAAVLLVLTFGLGQLFTRLRVPAPIIMAGLLVSGFAHGAGLVSGRFADPLTFFGFAVTGTMIGARFAGITLAEVKRLGLAGVVSTSVAVAIAMAGAWLVSFTLGLPFGQVWVSFAPGGVEGMSSMALALGYDPVYVATHHVFRILFLIAILPVLLGLLAAKR